MDEENERIRVECTVFEDEPGQLIGNAIVYAAFSTLVMSSCNRIHDEVEAETAQEEDIDEVDVTWEMIAPKLVDANKAKFMENKKN